MQNIYQNNQYSYQLPKINNNRLSPSDIRFKEAYQDCDLAYNMIKQRLLKIQNQKNLLLSNPRTPHKNHFNYYRGGYMQPPNTFFGSGYDMRMMSNAKGQIMNPNLYPHQFTDPIYYPLEMPLSGEPIALPNIEVGAPSQKRGNLNIGIKDIATLMAVLDEDNTDIWPADKKPNFFGENLGNGLQQLFKTNNLLNPNLEKFGNEEAKKIEENKKNGEGDKMNLEGDMVQTEITAQRNISLGNNLNFTNLHI